MESTGKALLQHWEWAAEKGLMNQNTARGLRAACNQVLSSLDDPETVDIKTLDIDDALRRFQNLKGREFKPNVLDAYKKRFRHAVEYFLDYLENPSGWRPRERPSGSERVNGIRGERTDSVRPPKQELPHTNMVSYPFPIREGQIAQLTLPRDLKASEVKRLSAFMSTLVAESESSG